MYGIILYFLGINSKIIPIQIVHNSQLIQSQCQIQILSINDIARLTIIVNLATIIVSLLL